jgi:aminopeptidase N
MKRIVFALIILCACSIYAELKPLPIIQEVPVSSPTSFIQQPFDVLHYDADIDLTKAPATAMSGVCRIKFVWTGLPDTNIFYFHLRDLKIDSTFYNDKAIVPSAKEAVSSPTYHYNVEPPKGTSQIGDTVILTIYYSGNMTGEKGSFQFGGVHTDGKTLYEMGVGFYNNYVSSAQHWLPCYDHPSDKATFHVKFKTKSDLFIASTGVLKTEIQGDNTTIYDWTENHQCSTYLFTFAVDNYIPVEGNYNNLPIVCYTRDATKTGAEYGVKYIPKMIESYEKYFGKYPFDKVGYVDTPVGAMEHQTMISITNNYFQNSMQSNDSLLSIAAHELSHQWFGDYVTCRDFRDAWLNEGFANFCESVWREHFVGFDKYLENQEANVQGYIKTDSKREKIFPIYDFPRQSPSSNYPNTIYHKGSAVVGMLRFELGDSLFFGGIREYFKKHAYGTATTAELQKDFEDFSGRSLDWFFKQWIYGKGYPVVNIYINKAPQGNGMMNLKINVRQIQNSIYGTYTNLPLELGFRQKDRTYIYKTLKLIDSEQNFELDSIPEYDTVTVNKGPTLRALVQVDSFINSILDYSSYVSNDIVISPNPSDDNMTINFPAEVGETFVEIINITGEIVYSNKYLTEDGRNESSLNVKNLASGFYILKVIHNNKINYKTIRILH